MKLRIKFPKFINYFRMRNEIVELWLDGFNDEGLLKAFDILKRLYNDVLYKDKQWHFFYEDRYSLVRCSLKYSDEVMKFFDTQGVQYRPPEMWTESTYMTVKYNYTYTKLFHNFSTLVLEMAREDDADQLYFAADRIIHPFLNNALYLAISDGQMDHLLDHGFEPDEWKSIKMMDLARGRVHHIGTIIGEKNIIKRINSSNKEKEKETLANSE